MANTNEIVNVSLVMPRALHERIAQAARANERSVSAELRFALQRVFTGRPQIEMRESQ